MAVLIEATNVVVPNKVIAARYEGGISAYRADVPNATFCTDGSLTRVGFMDRRDVERFVNRLVSRLGASLPTGGEWVDLAVVDQFTGPTMSAPWLECGTIDGTRAAWLRDEEPGPLAAPAAWKPGDSKSMTLWTPGPHGTVVARREANAQAVDWQQPQYTARGLGDSGGQSSHDSSSLPSAQASAPGLKVAKEKKKKRRKKRELRIIKSRQASRALYVDFEGRAIEGEPPVLLGYCVDDETETPSDTLRVKQFLLDRDMDPLLALVPELVPASIEDAVDEIIALSKTERRHVVSWSLHDRRLIRNWSRHQAFRYRSAIPTARRWRAGRVVLETGQQPVPFDDENLQSYLTLIGYEVPGGIRHGAGQWISTVRQRLERTNGDVTRFTAGGRTALHNLTEHNKHDVLGLRAVVRIATGLDEGPSGDS